MPSLTTHGDTQWTRSGAQEPSQAITTTTITTTRSSSCYRIAGHPGQQKGMTVAAASTTSTT